MIGLISVINVCYMDFFPINAEKFSLSWPQSLKKKIKKCGHLKWQYVCLICYDFLFNKNTCS